MEFVIKNKIGRSHRNMTALRFILLTETLVRSVHETGDLTGNLLRRVGIRLDRFGGQLVTSDDATDLREFNAVLLGNLEDDFRISEFTAPVDDQASQLTGLHAEMSASKPHHDFSRALTEKRNLAKNGFLLLGLLPCLLGLQFLLEFPDGLALNMHVFGIVYIIGDDILVGVRALRRNAGSLNRAVKGDNLEIVGGKLPEAVVNHVVADRIAVVLLLLNRLAQDKIELLDDPDDAVGFELIPGGRATGFEYVDLSGVAGEDFAFSVLAAGLGKKGEMAEVFQREPEISVEKLISHQRDLGGDTFLVDGVQDVNECGASSLFHDWTLLSVFVEGGVANTIDLLVLPSDERINPGFQEPFILGVKGRTR